MPFWGVAVFIVLASGAVSLNFTAPFVGVGVLKALPTCLLAVVAFRCTRARFGHLVTAAVACGAAGDFFLASMSQDWLMPGLVAFLLGHLLYIAAFRRGLTLTKARLAIVAGAAAALCLVAALMVRRLAVTGQYGLIAPGLLYALVIAAMMAVSVLRRSPTPWIALGALVFVISDTHIVVNHILLSAPRLALILSGYATYYLAQLLLVHGAARESAP